MMNNRNEQKNAATTLAHRQVLCSIRIVYSFTFTNVYLVNLPVSPSKLSALYSLLLLGVSDYMKR